ncbi:MAG TPA: M28 family peptidase, partial [Deltaproteobacteria bacterium]|nr:M28 family peptidase [Deltaproteobacteria bacterium]
MSMKITRGNIENVLSFTDEIVRRYPNRLIGTPSCEQAGIRIADEFAKNCDPGTVKREEFTCHPKSFLKYIRPAVLAYGASLIAALTKRPWAAVAGLSATLAVFVSQFMFYKKFFDPLFPEEKGYNVYGVIEPEGEVKQQVILCGHHDAAYVFHFMDLSPRFYPLLLVAGIVPFLLLLLYSLITAVTRFNPLWLRKMVSVLSPGVVPLWWFTTDAVSPGAGDNMIATALANEGAKLFADRKKAGEALKHTRIICLSVDGEECGLRGSMAYAARHARELTGIKTYAFCMDTLYHADKLIFFDNDLNLTVDCSHAMAQELTDIATSLGYKARVDHMPWGGGSTDAAAFAQKG